MLVGIVQQHDVGTDRRTLQTPQAFGTVFAHNDLNIRKFIIELGGLVTEGGSRNLHIGIIGAQVTFRLPPVAAAEGGHTTVGLEQPYQILHHRGLAGTTDRQVPYANCWQSGTIGVKPSDFV